MYRPALDEKTVSHIVDALCIAAMATSRDATEAMAKYEATTTGPEASEAWTNYLILREEQYRYEKLLERFSPHSEN